MKDSAVRILIVDDDEDDFLILKEYISNIEEQEFTVDWCYKYEEANKRICQGSHDLYFIDYRLGANTGLQLIQESIENNCEEPFILLTGNGNRTIDLKAMESGAVDYLVKGELSTEKLERCIRYSLERASFLKVLRANERKFRNIFERSKDTVFIADKNLLFTEVNNASFALLGYDRAELLSKSLYSFLSNANEVTAIEQQLATGVDVLDKEVEIVTRDGERKYCILTLSSEKDILGAVYIQGIIHEITALKRAEKTTLMLEKLNVANRLVRIMAHEVRNPLTNIDLAVAQIKADMPAQDEDSVMLFDMVTRNSKRINQLISELLNEARYTDLNFIKAPVNSIMDEALDLAKDRLGLNRIKVEKKYNADNCNILVDAEKIKIAFLNLIVNAIEAMEPDKGLLQISTRQEEDKCVVELTDNGHGMSEAELNKLFEPYYTTKATGNGLGLINTANIILNHKGYITVQSKEGIGTSFLVKFELNNSRLVGIAT